jgi:hypothetical protein
MRIKSLFLDRVKAVILPVMEEPLLQSNQGIEISYEAFRSLLERGYQYSVKVIQFIRETLHIVDPKLAHHDEITSSDSFENFWRTLIYNRVGDPRKEQQPPQWVGLSFGYCYMMGKLYSTRRWEENQGLFLYHLSVLKPLVNPFEVAFDVLQENQSFFVSESGRMGWAPISTSPGDIVAIFQGNRIPFVAKSIGNDLWEYAGGCYVHGLMDGEAHNTEDLEWKFMRFV